MFGKFSLRTEGEQCSPRGHYVLWDPVAESEWWGTKEEVKWQVTDILLDFGTIYNNINSK